MDGAAVQAGEDAKQGEKVQPQGRTSRLILGSLVCKSCF